MWLFLFPPSTPSLSPLLQTLILVGPSIVVASKACLSLGADFLALITCSLCCYPVTTEMETALLLPLLLLVKVNCQQTFPYVSFGLTGPALDNNSYVDLSTVGSESDSSDSVVCRTDLESCCGGSQGVHRGDWSFPDGTVLPFVGPGVPIGLGHGPQIAVIRRTTTTGPTGIYRCRIATNAVHSDTDISVRETVYVGLYPAELKRRLAADINLPIVIVLANTHQNSTPPSLLHCSTVAGA